MLQQQVRRMLKDPRVAGADRQFRRTVAVPARAAGTGIPTCSFSRTSTTICARHSSARPRLLFESIVREDRNVFDLLNADYTFVNERLARHYGIPNIYGERLPARHRSNEARRGLLGQGSFLTVTSSPNRTSPVTRGAWILENLLGSPPPLPPPNVPPFPETTTGQGVAEKPLRFASG